MRPDNPDSLREVLKAQGRRRRRKLSAMAATPLTTSRNDLLPQLALVSRDPKNLIIPSRNVRPADEAHVRRIVHSISVAGFVAPAVIDGSGLVIDGAARVAAAIRLNLPTIPCIVANHLTDSESRALRLALNRLGESGIWSLTELKAELVELVDLGIEIEDTGFTIQEFDQITIDDEVDPREPGCLAPKIGAQSVSLPGDVFTFGDCHRLICGDATDPAIYEALMQGEEARLVPTDPPYNAPIAGHVTKGDHKEFAMASGEMSAEEFLTFNQSWMSAAIPHLCDGGMLGTFIDWRGYPTVHAAATYLNLHAINLIVWNKTNGGMGSLYRSQHELFSLYKKGTTAHVNNIQLGKNGRWRSNVWTYPGASSVGSDSRKGLQLHPTVKPVALCADAILDLTDRGEVVLDPFLGSGSMLVAAEQTGRRCHAIELDPLYVDVAIRRYQEIFGKPVFLESTGDSFDTVEKKRMGPA